MSRRIAALLLALAVASAAVLCCAPARRRPAEREIVFWQFRPVAAVAPLVAEFERAHPGLRVRVERLEGPGGQARVLAAVASDSVPDLCQIGSAWMPGLLAGGRLADWSAGVADLRPSLLGWEMCSVGDALYGVPWTLETRALFYDKRLFARARLDSTRPPETWDDLRRAAAAIRRLGRGTRGFGIPAGERTGLVRDVLSFLWGNGGTVLSGDLRHAAFDSVANLEALEFYLGLRGASLLGSRDSLEREFERGRLGLLLAGPGLVRRLRERAPDSRFGVVLVPRPGRERGTHASWAGGEVLVSFNAAKHRHEALELARFLVRPASVAALAAAVPDVLPASRGADTSAFYPSRSREKSFLLQLGSARFTPGHPAWEELEAVLGEEFEQGLIGRKTAAQVVRDAQTRLAERLERR